MVRFYKAQYQRCTERVSTGHVEKDPINSSAEYKEHVHVNKPLNAGERMERAERATSGANIGLGILCVPVRQSRKIL